MKYYYSFKIYNRYNRSWDSCSGIAPVVGAYFTTGATGLLGFSYGITPAACSYVTTGAPGSGHYVLAHALVGLGGRLPAPPALQVLPENHAVARDPDQRCSVGLAAGAGTKSPTPAWALREPPARKPRPRAMALQRSQGSPRQPPAARPSPSRCLRPGPRLSPWVFRSVRRGLRRGRARRGHQGPDQEMGHRGPWPFLHCP